MKLLQKTNIMYLLFSAMLLMVVGISLYIILTAIIKEEVTEKLIVNKERIVKQIENGADVTSLYPVLDIEEIFIPAKESLIVKDTTIFDPIENETEPFREVSSIEKINGKIYKITVRQVIVESHEFYNTIGITLAIALIILLIGLILINRIISKRLWQPFYKNLDKLKNFSLENGERIEFKSSNIKEFEELKNTLVKLTDKILSDYKNLKEFSEDASHEIQTPLAIIKSKIETLFNANNLSKEQLETLNAVDDNLNRLSKLNKGLILLTKIENRQFIEKVSVDLNEIILDQISDFSELIELGNLKLSTSLNDKPEVIMDTSLAKLMISNLLSNAIKYTPPEGLINIETNKNEIVFSNSGKSESIDQSKVFKRFYKNESAPNSVGLGLAIVKKICDTNHLIIKYSFQNQTHFFTIQL